SHHRVAPDAEIPESGTDLPVGLQETQVIDIPAYSVGPPSELPDLDAANYPDYDEFESDGTEPPSEPPSRRPKRFRRTSAASALGPDPESREPKPKSRRRPILLAARSMAAFSAVLALVLTGGAWQWS